MKKWLLVLVWALLCPGLARAQPVVLRASVEDVRVENGVDVYVTNGYGQEITVTIDAELANMTSSAGNPATRTIPGRSRRLVTRLRRLDPSLGWQYRFDYAWVWGSCEAVHDDAA
ncbi:MAG: hypothetical protein AB1758_32550, partial [Candidatus Eremiobacterota bacterium]